MSETTVTMHSSVIKETYFNAAITERLVEVFKELGYTIKTSNLGPMSMAVTHPIIETFDLVCRVLTDNGSGIYPLYDNLPDGVGSVFDHWTY